MNEVLAMLVGSNATKQQKIDARASQPSCNGCHQYIDPIGVGLEKYDGIGVWRATPPVPTAAQIPGVGGFDGAVQLSQLVATQEATRNCFARRLAQFALGSDLDDPTKTDWMTAATSAFNAKQLEVQELVVGIVRHSAFIERHIVRE